MFMLYEYDAGVDKGLPGSVIFPATTEDVSGIVKIAVAEKVPIVPRGAGTGLSGGAIARDGGIVIVFTRMNKILEVDVANQRATVQPGVVNLDLTSAVEKHGLYFAPDPSSQKASTIGGNVAENSGGPHTLAHVHIESAIAVKQCRVISSELCPLFVCDEHRQARSILAVQKHLLGLVVLRIEGHLRFAELRALSAQRVIDRKSVV